MRMIKTMSEKAEEHALISPKIQPLPVYFQMQTTGRSHHKSLKEPNLISTFDSENRKYQKFTTFQTSPKFHRNSGLLQLPTAEEIPREGMILTDMEESPFHKKELSSKQCSLQTQECKDHNDALFRNTIENFDKMKIFKFYFPQNNLDIILKRFKGRRTKGKNRKVSVSSPSKNRKKSHSPQKLEKDQDVFSWKGVTPEKT